MRCVTVAALCPILLVPSVVHAVPEICGNSIDDSGDFRADEGCFPAGVPGNGICESPLGCEVTGAVSPYLGALVRSSPADLAPRVAFGPDLVFQRTYLSMYEPGYTFPNATTNKAPLGYRWHHNFMSWATRSGSGNNKKFIIHLPTGQEVMVLRNNSDGTYTYYNTYQSGWFFKDIKQKNTSPYTLTVTLTSGVTYEYNDFTASNDESGLLTAVKDTLASPNTLLTLSSIKGTAARHRGNPA